MLETYVVDWGGGGTCIGREYPGCGKRKGGGGRIWISYLLKNDIANAVVLGTMLQPRHSFGNALCCAVIISQLSQSPDNHIIANEDLQRFVGAKRGRETDESPKVLVRTLVAVDFAKLGNVLHEDSARDGCRSGVREQVRHLRKQVLVERAIHVIEDMQMKWDAAQEPFQSRHDLASTDRNDAVQELQRALLDVGNFKRKPTDPINIFHLAFGTGPVLAVVENDIGRSLLEHDCTDVRFLFGN